MPSSLRLTAYITNSDEQLIVSEEAVPSYSYSAEDSNEPYYKTQV